MIITPFTSYIHVFYHLTVTYLNNLDFDALFFYYKEHIYFTLFQRFSSSHFISLLIFE